jgi:hypothetical protein
MIALPEDVDRRRLRRIDPPPAVTRVSESPDLKKKESGDSAELFGFMVAGEGFEPSTFGL